MTNITIPAPAKINLSLRIVGKREDGYHLLESLVVFAKYGDEIEVQPAKELSLEIIGEFADALQNEPKEKNLVWRAAVALRRHCEEALADAAIQKSEENKGWIASCHATLAVRNAEVVRSGAKITLTKNLPIGSGIGGGSADAAATLKALCQLWKLDISPEELAEIGLKLGSDVPVCLYGKPAIMRGIGEIITPALPPAQKYIVLLNPLISLSTAEVFSSLREGVADEAIHKTNKDWIASASLRNDESNDLQPAAISKLPIIAEMLGSIKVTKNCKFAQMSGSGATCFGLYEIEIDAKNAAENLRKKYPQMWCVATRI